MDNKNTGLIDRYEIDDSLFTPEELEEIYSAVSPKPAHTVAESPKKEKKDDPESPTSTRPPLSSRRRKHDESSAQESASVAPAEKGHIGILTVAVRCLSVVLVTVVIILLGALGVVYMMTKGPSDSARDLFVMSVRETSAIGFLADIFLSEDEIYAIENNGRSDIGADSVDTSLITVKHKDKENSDDPSGSDDGINDPDGDGIEIVDISGSTFNGKLMIIYDPSRVVVGISENLGSSGQTLESMISSYGAVGGVNGGGFYDPNGSGNGGIPDGVVVHNGVLLYGGSTYADTAVIDYDGILHVGTMTGQQAMELNARWAVSFGPVLIVNGEKCDGLSSGLNPRTAIAQRSDGAIMLLVINGRQLDSLGATYDDVADVLLEHGAVNALNLDGGSSSNMMFRGEYQNISASVIGYRPLPTCVLVLDKEVEQ